MTVELVTERWAYHATFPSLLTSIGDRGLQPRKVTGQERRAEWEDTDGVYFSNAQGYHLEYGPVLLRFPWPETWAVTFRVVGSPPLIEGIVRMVSSESIEVLTEERGWCPIRTALSDGLAMYDADAGNRGYSEEVFE